MIYNLKIMIIILPVIFWLYVVTVLNLSAASTDSTVNKRATNEDSKTSSSYDSNDFVKHASEYPYSAFATSSVINMPAIVHDGLILKNVTPTKLEFKSWGVGSELVLKKFYKNHLMQLLKMSGSTGKNAGGFVSNNLDYKGRYISLVIGNITKPFNKDFQVSIVFSVTGAHGLYQLRFVHGPLFVSGWVNGNYYEKLSAYSSRLIDLNNFINDDRLSVKQISIVMQSGSTLNSLEFRIDMGRTTENPPVVLRGDKSYSVVGNITTAYNMVLKSSRYIFHNLGFNRLVTLDLSPVADNGKLIDNGWNITSTREWKDNSTNVDHLLVTAQRQITTQELSPNVFYNLDIYQSLSKLGPRDYLFLVVITTPLLLYRFRETSS